MNIKMLACSAFALMLGTANVFAQEEEDMTHFIVNAGFDEDITWTVDGKTKEIVGKEKLSDRSEAWYSEDNSVYAHSLGARNRKDDIPSDQAWNGFIGHIQGWTLESNKAIEPPYTTSSPEWVYFGSVPYGIGAQAVPIADDGDTFLAAPEKPAEDNGEDNKAAVYLRAGWGGQCVYKQVVKLPCAQYRLDYWVLNANYEGSKNNTKVQNLCQVQCRKDVFVDEDGFNAQEWTLHSIEFTPTSEFTIQFGFKSDGGSNSNPFIFIDGIKLYKIGEANEEELLMMDVSDMVDSLSSFYDNPLLGNYSGLLDEVSEVISAAEDATTLEEMTQAIADMNAFAGKLTALLPTVEEYAGYDAQAIQISESSNPYPGFDAFTTAYDEISAGAQTATTDTFADYFAQLKEAINAYYFSQEVTDENPADYSFLISAPHFTTAVAAPTYENGIATYPVEEELAAGSTPSFATKGNWNNTGYVTDGDQRLNYAQGRVCWNLWDNHAGLHAIQQELSGLPNGYYTVTADMITQPDYVYEAHVFAKSTAAEAASPFLAEGNWSDANDGTWTTLTTEKVIVADGKLTIGGKSNFPEGSQKGWFCITNVKLHYYGPFTAEDYKVIFDQTVADVEAMCDTMVFKGDKAAFAAVIAEFKNAATIEDMTAALDTINKSKAVAQASIDKWIGVNTGSWANLKDSITAGVYTANATALAQKVVDFMTAEIYADTATYTTMDARTEILRKYRDNFLPKYMEVEGMTNLTSEAANGVIVATLAQIKKELDAIVTFPTAATMDTYVAILNAAVAEAVRLEALNVTPAAGADFTGLIKNADINADSNGTGWTISKGAGNTNTAGGQQYDGDGNGRYLDSYNGTAGALNYTAYQTLENIPNGTYQVKAMTRASNTGAYLYAIADNDTVNGKFTLLKSNANFNFTQWVDNNLVNAEGTDSIGTTTDTYGPIWMESAAYVRDVMGIRILTDLETGTTVDAYIAEWLEGNVPTEEQNKHLNIVKANTGKGRGWAYHTVEVEVKNHTLTLGVSTDSTFTVGHTDTEGNPCVPFAGTWFSADNFVLTMLSAGDNTGWDGSATGIEGVENNAAAVSVENGVIVTEGTIYSISGTRVANGTKVPAGVYIIRNGKNVQKVLVK